MLSGVVSHLGAQVPSARLGSTPCRGLGGASAASPCRAALTFQLMHVPWGCALISGNGPSFLCQCGLASWGLWPMVPMFILMLVTMSVALIGRLHGLRLPHRSLSTSLSVYMPSYLLPPCLSSRIPTSSSCPGSLQVGGWD